MKGKSVSIQLQSLRTVAIDKLSPFLLAPIGNGKPVDGEERSFLLILDDTDFAILFRKLSLVQPRIGFSRSSLGSFRAIHLRYPVVRETHLSEHQTDIQKLVETTEEAFYPIPLFLVNLHSLFQFGNGSVPSLDRVLQENDLLSDFILLLF